MNQFGLSTLLCTIAIVAVLMGLTMRFPGPMILLASFVPLFLVFRYARLGKGPGAELKLIALLAFTVIPPYIAAGPVIYAPHS